jgi:hypothetical protein
VNGKHVNGKTHINGLKSANGVAAYAHLNDTHLPEHVNGEALA